MVGIAEGLVCGRSEGAPVSSLYASPFPFAGRIYRVTVDVSGEMIRDTEAEMKAVMGHQ